MKLSKKQQNDLESILWFIPSWCKYEKPTGQDIEDFFEYSEKGKFQDRAIQANCPNKHGKFPLDGFSALIQGKRWRGIHVNEMYRKGLEGDARDGKYMAPDVPLAILFENMPEVVKNYVSKELCL
jgi:hypothetical protein